MNTHKFAQFIGRLITAIIVLGITAFFTPGFNSSNIGVIILAILLLTLFVPIYYTESPGQPRRSHSPPTSIRCVRIVPKTLLWIDRTRIRRRSYHRRLSYQQVCPPQPGQNKIDHDYRSRHLPFPK